VEVNGSSPVMPTARGRRGDVRGPTRGDRSDPSGTHGIRDVPPVHRCV